MIESTWIEAATRWLVTYAAHSAALALVGLGVALLCFRAGERRATVLKVALVGALVSASLPWKALQPLELLPAPELTEAMVEAGTASETVIGTEGALGEASLASTLAQARSSIKNQKAAPQPALSRLAAITLLLGALSLIGVLHLVRSRTRFLRALQPVPVDDAASSAVLNAWTQADGRPTVALTSSSALRGPVLVSSREICVPEGLWSRLSPNDRQAALAHEYAHIERRDPFWFLATAALSRALYFLPWHGLLRERWVAAAEFACDRRAAIRIGSERDVAQCLSSVAEWSVAEAAHRESAPRSLAAMAATPGELVQRVESVLGSEEAPSSGRFRWACIAAVAAFACGAPQVGSSRDEASNEAAPGDNVIEIRVAPDRMITLEDPGGHSELERLTIRHQGREAQGRVADWLASAAADFPMVPWPSTGTMVRSGTVLLRTTPGTPFRDIQHLMRYSGDVRVQIPDVRMEVDGTTYRIPLPVDVGVGPGEVAVGPEGVRTDIRMDSMEDSGGSIEYTVGTQKTLPFGTAEVPTEEDAANADDPFIGRSAVPRKFNSLDGFAAWLDEQPASTRVVQGVMDPRKGVTVKDVAAVLDILNARGITDITYKGSYER
jgi:Zn-dependent protease with chaperone function